MGGGQAEEEQEQQGQRLLGAERSLIQRSSSLHMAQISKGGEDSKGMSYFSTLGPQCDKK